MGDDIKAPHAYDFRLHPDATLREMLQHLMDQNYLAHVAGKGHRWDALIDGQIIAEFLANEKIPQPSEYLLQPISEFAQNGVLSLKFKYAWSTI